MNSEKKDLNIVVLHPPLAATKDKTWKLQISERDPYLCDSGAAVCCRPYSLAIVLITVMIPSS